MPETDNQEHFGLTWPGKREARHLASLPPQNSLIPQPGEGLHETSTGNIFIEGDNLEALKLLQAGYAGRVKLIYIDPPYNTGSDFIYPDNYREPLAAYQQRTGGRGTSGAQLNGRFHANWLSLMYPRLLLARQLLRDDGLIFVSIDDHEVHHLRALMDEIFGEECFKNAIIVRRGIKNVQAQFETIDSLSVGHEYILMYAKNANTRFKQFRIQLDKPRAGSWNNHWRGTERPTMRYELFGITPERGQWRWSEGRSRRAVENYARMAQELGYRPEAAIPSSEIDAWYLRQDELAPPDLLRLSKSGKPEHYVPPNASKMGSDLWIDLGPRDNTLTSLMGRQLFTNPKPVAWIQRIVKFATEPHAHDLVLDFFAGSATTAHAIFAQNLADGGNRQFILVQLPEPTDGDFKSIAEIGKERIRRAVQAMQARSRENEQDWGFRCYRLEYSR